MRQAEWLPTARADLERILARHEPLSPIFAERLAFAATKASRFLAEMPDAGPPLTLGTRKWTITGFEFVLIYRITDSGVDIVRMHHARENWRPQMRL